MRGVRSPGERDDTPIRDAVVLAGGRGTRMRGAAGDLPKPLVEIGGRAMLVHILERMAEAGIEAAHVVVGYKAEAIERALRGAGLALQLHFHLQTEPRGTADALLRAAAGPQGRFLLSWADIVLPVSDYRALIDAAADPSCDAVLGVNRVDDPFEGAAVYLDAQGLVERVVEKPPRGTSTTSFNNAGIFALPLTAFDAARAVEPSPRGELEFPQALDAMIAGGTRFRAVEVAGWVHVGTPEELERARSSQGSTTGAHSE